ncbi:MULTISPECIES: SHOCT domain-containing protein [Marinomonas]|nr:MULTISPECIES: hypothetical protein [Marinomonas]
MFGGTREVDVMWHDHMWSGPGMMGWGFIPMVLFWLLVIGVFVFLFRLFSGKRSEPSDDSSLQILKDRLASGDIDQVEFDSLYDKLKHAH